MHGGVGQEVLQTHGLRDAACQKGEKTKKFNLGSSQLLDGGLLSVFFRHFLKVLSVCALNVKTKLAPYKKQKMLSSQS